VGDCSRIFDKNRKKTEDASSSRLPRSSKTSRLSKSLQAQDFKILKTCQDRKNQLRIFHLQDASRLSAMYCRESRWA
jgi:hypothetical protein